MPRARSAVPKDARAYEAAERPHPIPLLSPEAIGALYAGDVYQDQLRRIEDNTPLSRGLRFSPLTSTMDL